jgi:hypothetical protein
MTHSAPPEIFNNVRDAPLNLDYKARELCPKGYTKTVDKVVTSKTAQNFNHDDMVWEIRCE